KSSQMRNQLRKLHPAVPEASEREGAGQQDVLVLCPDGFELIGMWLAVALRQFGLGVEQVDLTGSSFLAELNHRPGLAGKVPRSPRHVVVAGRFQQGARRFVSLQPVAIEQKGERQAPHSQAGRGQEFSPGECKRCGAVIHLVPAAAESRSAWTRPYSVA